MFIVFYVLLSRLSNILESNLMEHWLRELNLDISPQTNNTDTLQYYDLDYFNLKFVFNILVIGLIMQFSLLFLEYIIFKLKLKINSVLAI